MLIFGVSGALTHARVRELKSELEKTGLTVVLASDTTQLQQALRNSKSKVEWAVWAGLTQPSPPNLKNWVDAFGSTASTVKFGALVGGELNATHKRELKNPTVVRNQDSLNELLQLITQAKSVASVPAPNRNPTVSSTKLASDPLEDLILSMEDHSANAKQKAELPLAAPIEQGQPIAFQVQPMADEISIAAQLGFDESSQEDSESKISKVTGRARPSGEKTVYQYRANGAPNAALASEQPAHELSALSKQVEPQSDFQVDEESALHEMLKQDEGAFDGPKDISDNTAATVFGVLDDELKAPQEALKLDAAVEAVEDDAGDEQVTQLGVSPLAKVTQSPLAGSIGTDPLTGIPSENKRAPVALQNEPSISLDDIKFTKGGSLTELDTLKRYAALKERESREREATVDMLQKQMGQVKERMLKSENERRRLTLEMDDLRVKLRSLEDVRDQHSHQSNRSEAAHNENLKSLQLRLDNAQFQAHKAEKKLEEFRERVRNDILKIRLKERELSNKLELQKRDAEALLSAKDERLLAQKREIDRLEFEIDNLKERMIDDTRRAEERAAKLTRALKSLRMAQGMLSGIQEEVLPGTGGNDSDGEAA